MPSERNTYHFLECGSYATAVVNREVELPDTKAKVELSHSKVCRTVIQRMYNPPEVDYSCHLIMHGINLLEINSFLQKTGILMFSSIS